MNKWIFLLLIFFLLPSIYSVSYDDIIKVEARGDYDEAIKLYNLYFEENLNGVNQDSIIEKLLHSSTLYSELDKTLEHLIYYVKYMKNPHSRFIIYRRIGEIYELSGSIYMAGIYYEKAAYTNDDYLDYDLMFDSVEILIELGYLNLSNRKLDNVPVDGEFNHDRYNLIKARIYYLLGDRETALHYWSEIGDGFYKKSFFAKELGMDVPTDRETLDDIILNYPFMRLRTPTDYFFLDSVISEKSGVKQYKTKEVEIFLGRFNSEEDIAGTVNILEQLNLPWFLDRDSSSWDLYLFTLNYNETIEKLNKLGIHIGE